MSTSRTVDITKAMLEQFATASLEGLLFELGLGEPQPITLRFEIRPLSWCQANGGPDQIILPEYVPMCLAKSMVNLARRGYELTIEEYNP